MILPPGPHWWCRMAIAMTPARSGRRTVIGSPSDVRQRNLSWIATLTREFAGKRVMAITHHLTILSTRANFERLSPERFIHLDEHEKPVNCGVTRYEGNPAVGRQGRLELAEYNRKYY